MRHRDRRPDTVRRPEQRKEVLFVHRIDGEEGHGEPEAGPERVVQLGAPKAWEMGDPNRNSLRAVVGLSRSEPRREVPKR